ncbi:MAG: TIGR04282 family arsenosugar biosynthesis glycosyltransferase [Cyanobacteria bacterium P01_F01_bin.143]
MNESLIIFTRYPEPGKTKTRMIPALGAEGAAELQRQLSEHTIQTAQKLQESRQIEIEIHFAGGDRDLMSSWLGNNHSYYPQASGDLGAKMQSAFAKAFEQGKQRIVTIGIDCPDITPTILNQAFDSLKSNELVLGGAEDGGYYLIGLSKLVPELFQDINWGTDSVFATTKAIAQKLALSIGYLPVLADIDRPEDLEIAQRHNLKFYRKKMPKADSSDITK